MSLCIRIFMMAVCFLPVQLSYAAESREAFEERISGELRRSNPKAVPLFRGANQAREMGDLEKAAELYEQVQQLAPDFDHAIRRRCSVELEMKHRNKAVRLCRESMALDESVENMAALSLALATGKGDIRPPRKDVDEAIELGKRAVAFRPDDVFALGTLCRVALAAGNRHLFADTLDKLKKVAPDELGTHLFATVAAIQSGRYDDAAESLERAREAGLAEESYERLSRDIEQRRRFLEERGGDSSGSQSSLVDLAMDFGWVGVIVWLGVLVALLVLAWILSAVILRIARRVPRTITGDARGLDALVRKVYRLVLWLCCGYYYLSIPILLLLVVGVGGGIIWGFFAAGTIPIKLVALVGILMVVTVYAVLRSLFVRGIDEDPGEVLSPGDHPGLQSVLREVAGRVGTRPVDKVYLTPGTDVAVMERGGMWRQLTGRKERCLILGLGVLDGMKISHFKGILAHEYGHFSNQDTAGGGFAIAVRRSLLTMAESLARGGAAAWYNPAWLFLNFFYRVFLRVSQGASRLQEVLADRWAAAAYGSQAFEEGLEHVIRQSIRFEMHADRTLGEVIEQKKSLKNLYTYRPAKRPEEEVIEEAVAEAIHAKPSPYDSHPSPAERFAWVKALGSHGTGLKPGDQAPVWSLFEKPEQLQQNMTDQVKGNLAMDGYLIPG